MLSKSHCSVSIHSKLILQIDQSILALTILHSMVGTCTAKTNCGILKILRANLRKNPFKLGNILSNS